jgi:hypothetical protein
VVRRHALERRAAADDRARRAEAAGGGAGGEGANLLRVHARRERLAFESIGRFAAIPEEIRRRAEDLFAALDALTPAPEPPPPPRSSGGPGDALFARRAEPKGPMTGFGYSYLDARLEDLGLEKPRLAGHEGLWGSGVEYAYEALNLVDGRRTARQIRDDLAAAYGPVPLDLVVEYLQTLERIGILDRR